MFDVLLLLYQGEYANATFLQILNADSMVLERTSFGEIGRAKYTLNAAPEDLSNLITPNRIDCYVYRDLLSVSSALNATTLTVKDGTRFAVGQTIAVYDGVHFDLASITSIAGNVVSLNQHMTNAYALGSSVLRLVHTGRLSVVDADVNRQRLQPIETQSYFQELGDFVCNDNINKYECGWVLYNALKKYQSSLDMVINASNFIMDATGTGTGGTGVQYTAVNGQVPLLQLVQEVVKTANGNSGNVVYRLWIDELNVLHFGTVQATTPTVTYNLAGYTQSSTGDGLFDVVISHTTHDQDLTTVKNTYSLVGGKDASGSPVTARIFDQNSVNQYGQKESVISNPSLTSVDALRSWGTALLNETAYPARHYVTDVEPSFIIPTCTDYISVTGFTDAHVENYAPLTTELSWKSSAPGQFHIKITGAEVLPDINRIMKGIATEHYIPVIGITSGGVNLSDRFVQNGLQGSYAQSSSVFNVTAGVMNANLQVSGVTTLVEFDINAFSFTVPTDDTYTVAYLYRNTDGTVVTSPQMVTFQGLTVPQGQGYTDYQIVPLWTVTRLGGTITHGVDRRNQGGISGPNINASSIGNKQMQGNPNLASPPALAASTTVSGPTYPVAGGGAYDAALTFTLSVTNPDWLSNVRLYSVPAGGQYSSQRSFKGDLTPTSTGAYTSIYGALSSGQAFDLYACLVDNKSIESPPLLLATTVSQTLNVLANNLPAMPANITPNKTSGVVTFAYPTVGNATYDAQTPITLDINGTTASSWCEAVELVAQPYNNSNNWTVYNTLPSNSGGGYNCVWGGLGAGGVYTLGLRYRGYRAGDVSNVLVLGDTVGNPVQGPAIAAGSVDTSKTTGIFDTNGQMLYSKNPPAVQTAIGPNGTVQAGQLIGTIPYGANGSPITSTVSSTAQTGTSGNTYLTNSAVSTNQVQSVSIIHTQLATSRYDTSLSNIRNGASYQWYSEGSGSYLATNGTIINGSTITYDVGTAIDTTSATPATNTYMLPASGNCQVRFKHNKFTTGGVGNVAVNFTGSAVTQGAPIADSPVISGSDQPSITHTVTANYTEDIQQYTIPSESSTATITQNTNPTTYTLTQHNSGVLSSNSTATISGSTSYPTTTTASTNISLGMGVQSYTDTTSPNAGCQMQTWSYVLSGNAYIASQAVNTGANAYCDSARALSLNYSLPSNIAFVTGSYGSTEIWHKIGTPDQWFYSCSTTRDTRTYPSFPITWNVTLKNPSGVTIQTWTNVSGNSSLSSTAGAGATGTYTWFLKPQFTTDPGGTTAPDTSAPATGTSTTTYPYASPAYTSNNAAWTLIFQTPAGMVAPTSAGTQLNFHCNSVANVSNAQGSAAMHVVITRTSDGTWVKDCGYLAAGDYTYFVTSEAGTQYNVYARAEITGNTNTGTSSYACNVNGNFYWYNNDVNPATYSYPTSNGAVHQATTDNNANIDAPTSTAVQVGVYISSLTPTSNAYGASTLYMNILDPNNNVVVNGQAITSVGTWGYSNAAAIKGQYKFNLYAVITTNNSNSPGTQSFPVTFAGYAFDYNHVNHPITTYFNNSGTTSQYLTASSSVAPNSATQYLQLNLTSLTAQGASSSFGTNDVCVQLQDPTGTYLAFQYSTDGGTTWTTLGAQPTWAPNGHPVGVSSVPIIYRYYDAAQSHTGVYTWTIYGMVNNNGTGDAQYTNSWSGTQTYFVPGPSGGNTYVLASDGTTQRTATNDADIKFVLATPEILTFTIYNNAAQAVSFTLGQETIGV